MQKAARWPAVLLAAACLVVALLSIVAWRLLAQEEALERERLRERLENAAGLVVRESERALAQAIEDETASLGIEWDERGLWRVSGAPLLWSPVPVPVKQAPPALFGAGETLEYGQDGLARAIAEYRKLVTHSDPAVRAGALMRIARCQRKSERTADAIETYRQLALAGNVSAGGAPAELVGLRERGVMFDAAGRTDEASTEREKLRSVLQSARHSLDRATFEFYAQGLTIDPRQRAWAEAVEKLWRRAADTRRGTAILSAGDEKYIIQWNRENGPGAGRLVSAAALGQRVARALVAASVEWQLTDAAGDRIAGAERFEGASAGRLLTMNAGETGLPWGLAVAVTDAQPAFRAPMLIAGLALLCLAILAALYLAYRAIQRELRVARMQSEFVAAVSHEFRTPITALTHLTELLESGGAAEERRPLYYAALARETRRLRDMVENLLDFGRIEAGRYRYKPEDIDVTALVQSLVNEFRDQPAAQGHELVCESEPRGLHLTADREALRRAVWNLLDNAAKYSPPGTRITARVAGDNGTARVSVQDEGPGIAREDQKRIFQKFVRGVSGGRDEVKGTGIGLAMVDAIARAHGGRVELDSSPGAGSRFTMVLPCERSE